GRRPARHDPGRARGTLRRPDRRQRRLSQCRRRLAHRRAGGRPRRRGGAGLGLEPAPGPGRDRDLRRDRPLGRGAPSGASRGASQRGRQAGLHHRAGAALAGPRQGARADRRRCPPRDSPSARSGRAVRGRRTAPPVPAPGPAGSRPMNGLDLAVVTVIVMSGVFAFARGFVKEALSIVAWDGAAFAALYGSAYLLPMAGRALPKGPTTEVVAGIVLFLVVLVTLSLLT